ncbi:MAG TPA: CotH kinase family protein [Chitinophagaceae bacterium]|nr:CotH kinase family protein [Chitinophagaceae bacterium]
MKKLLLLFSFLFFNFLSNAQLIINEYSCSNISGIQDAYNQRHDWLELLNTGATPLNITGYYISDDPANLTKWQIPNATPINAGERRMVFYSGRGLVHPTGQIHPDFKLKQTLGDWVIISDASGNVIDSMKTRITQRNHSYGRTTDGAATWGFFSTPTPNTSNNAQTSYLGYAPKCVFNMPAGFYVGNQSVSISNPDPNVTIRYTIDGSAPTVASPIFAAPISVNATTVIRAVGFSSIPTILPSQIETNTYFINENSSFNVVSVAGKYTGAGSLFNNTTPTFSSFEYFTPNGTQIFELEGGRASKHGNDSWAYPQKGIDFEALDESGDKASFFNQLFQTSLRDTFDRIMLKAGGSDNYTGGPNNSTHIRDAFAQTLAEHYGLDMDFRRWRPVLLFINGQYWGLYDLRERVDGDFIKYYYGKKKEKVDHLSYWGGLNVRLGSDTGWVNLYNFIMTNNMAVQSNYDHVKQFLNINSFCQYFILNTYLVNHDWLNWNTMWWRARGNNTPIKWRYVLWDMDAILGLNNPNYTGIQTTGYQADPCEPTNLFQNNQNIKHTDMLTKLMNSPEFLQTYKDNWIMMLNGPLNCQNILAHWDSVVNIITPEMSRQAIRWGGTLAAWQANCTQARTFLVNRCAVIGTKLDSCLELNPQLLKLNVSPTGVGNIAINGSIKGPYVWSNILQADSIYTLKATSTNPYYIFDHWEKFEPLNGMTPNMTSDQVQFNFKKEDSVVAVFRYFNPDSINVTFNVTPVGSGSISLNGNIIPSYPTTIKLDRNHTYYLDALPVVDYDFVQWQKNNQTTIFTPNTNTKSVSFKYDTLETIVAEFNYNPPPPPPPPPPPVPPIPNLTDVKETVFIPNAFTPNGDGNNDEFKIKVGKDVLGVKMEIYDRWGKLVFTSNEIKKGWNGKYNNIDAEIGTYQYFVRVRLRDKSIKTYKGDFTLLR